MQNAVAANPKTCHMVSKAAMPCIMRSVPRGSATTGGYRNFTTDPPAATGGAIYLRDSSTARSKRPVIDRT